MRTLKILGRIGTSLRAAHCQTGLGIWEHVPYWVSCVWGPNLLIHTHSVPEQRLGCHTAELQARQASRLLHCMDTSPPGSTVKLCLWVSMIGCSLHRGVDNPRWQVVASDECSRGTAGAIKGNDIRIIHEIRARHTNGLTTSAAYDHDYRENEIRTTRAAWIIYSLSTASLRSSRRATGCSSAQVGTENHRPSRMPVKRLLPACPTPDDAAVKMQ